VGDVEEDMSDNKKENLLLIPCYDEHVAILESRENIIYELKTVSITEG